MNSWISYPSNFNHFSYLIFRMPTPSSHEGHKQHRSIIMTMIVRKDWVVSQRGPESGRRVTAMSGCWGPALCPRVPLWDLCGPRPPPGWPPCHSQEGACSQAARSQWGHSTPLLESPPTHSGVHWESHCLCRAPSESSWRQHDGNQIQPTPRPRLHPSHCPPMSTCGPKPLWPRSCILHAGW